MSRPDHVLLRLNARDLSNEEKKIAIGETTHRAEALRNDIRLAQEGIQRMRDRLLDMESKAREIEDEV